MARDKISACLTVGNEENEIERCLKSLSWVDEIVVIDSFSKDRTVELCKKYTDRVYQHEWLGYVGQKDLVKNMASNPWIFFVDADEEVSTRLRDEVIAEFESGANKLFVGYEFPRKVFFMGAWVTHGEWWPDIKMRLFLKANGLCAGREPHDQVIVDGPVKRLGGCLYHYTYLDLADQVKTLNRFSTISCMRMMEDDRKFRASDILFRPIFRFFRGYVLKRGFLEGYRGLIVAGMVALGVFLKYAKLWEAINVDPAAVPDEDGK